MPAGALVTRNVPFPPHPQFAWPSASDWVRLMDMRLLPRSRRGTWLLAGAVWCAACAGLWWALPVVPCGGRRLPQEGLPLGFLSNGELAISGREIVDLLTMLPAQMRRQCGPISIFDVTSGRQLRTLLSDKDRFNHCLVSDAGRWPALINDLGHESERLRLRLDRRINFRGSHRGSRDHAHAFRLRRQLARLCHDRWHHGPIVGATVDAARSNPGRVRMGSPCLRKTRTQVAGGPEADPSILQIEDSNLNACLDK